MLACITYTIHFFKSQVSAIVRALLNLNARFGTVFSISDIKDCI